MTVAPKYLRNIRHFRSVTVTTEENFHHRIVTVTKEVWHFWEVWQILKKCDSRHESVTFTIEA